MHIQKPISRSRLRQFLGKEFYIVKRKFSWLFGKQAWASKRSSKRLDHEVFHHKSMILRPLKDVEMYLQENKRTNLQLAIEKLNGLIIQPNETMSFWKLVGRPTKAKGYLEGLVLIQGNTGKDTGGGLCQLGNLLFWIFAHSPLVITERYRHGYDVFPDTNRSIPFGAGATLSYNHIDFQVKNETNNAFQINLWLDKTHLHGSLHSTKALNFSYKIEERNHIIKHQNWGGYSRHNQIFKIVSDKEITISESLIVENHAIMMYNPFLEEKVKRV